MKNISQKQDKLFVHSFSLTKNLEKMMNGVALLLILGSVISGSVLSPKLSESHQNPNIIVKEGHSVVVVEYIGEGKESNTKISIYPKDYYDGLEKVGEAKKTASENVGKMKEVVGEGSSKVMDGVHKVKEAVSEGGSKVMDGVHKVKEVVGEGSCKVMDGVHKVKEAVGERSGKVKDAVHKIESDMVDMPKTAFEDIKSNLSNLADTDRADIEEFVCGTFGRCKEGLGKAEGETKEGVTRAAGKTKEVVSDTSSKVKDVTKKVKDSVAVDTTKRAIEDIEGNVSMIGDTMIEATRMDSLMGVVQLLGFSMAFGMSMWMTFVSCYILGDALPREQFGMLQSGLYPIYYKILAYSTGVTFIAHLFCRRKKIVSSSAEIFYSINLVMSLLMSFGNFLYLEPKATQIMSERFKVEKEGREEVTSHPRSGIANDAGDPVTATTEQQGEVKAETRTARLSEKLQMINRISSYANNMTLISLWMHMVYLGLQIQDSASGSGSGGFGRGSGGFGGPPPS